MVHRLVQVCAMHKFMHKCNQDWTSVHLHVVNVLCVWFLSSLPRWKCFLWTMRSYMIPVMLFFIPTTYIAAETPYSANSFGGCVGILFFFRVTFGILNCIWLYVAIIDPCVVSCLHSGCSLYRTTASYCVLERPFVDTIIALFSK